MEAKHMISSHIARVNKIDCRGRRGGGGGAAAAAATTTPTTIYD